MKDRNSKLSSLRAEKERDTLKECTFRPIVNQKSTRIAYKQVIELHTRDKNF